MLAWKEGRNSLLICGYMGGGYLGGDDVMDMK
jgi:hypothetical protein